MHLAVRPGLILALLASVGCGCRAASGLPSLPEGRGIAAAYPGDAGIEKHPAVVFADGFEDIEAPEMATGYREQKGRKWDNAWGLLRIVTKPRDVHSGKQAIEVTHIGPVSHGAWRHLESSFDRLFVRYYMKYSEDFPGCHHTGMLLLAAASGMDVGKATGVRPNGTNHFLVALDAAPPWTGWSPEPPGYLHLYCYHMDQGGKWGDQFFPTGESYPHSAKEFLGDGFVPRPQADPERGRWCCYELMLQANTPGQRDGRIAFWVDGKLAGDLPGLRFRTVDTLKVNDVVLSSYSSRRHSGKTLWYDDVVAATSYIGPQAAPGGPK
jgi:hypothetical protein